MSSDLTLVRHPIWPGPRGPVVLAILDGVGLGRGDAADAVKLARTPTLDALLAGCATRLRAHGTAVGLPSDDDMGNSEVGHNALGAGVVHDQGALLVRRAIASGSLFEGAVWRAIVERCRGDHATLHFLGLLSDGNVHSHIDHLEAMLEHAARAGVRRVRVHALLDGRDVAPTSALRYVERLEATLARLRAAGIDARIASGGGRMQVTMDRYEADWRIVERGWQAHVRGYARRFASAGQAVVTLRDDHPGIIDQDLPPFVIADEVGPLGRITDGDAVVMFNFRGDRAIEITRAFDDGELMTFDRGLRPDVLYAGMMQYDGDLHLPRNFLVSPPTIDRTMGERLARSRVSQLAISETQKYGHVTYFWNGNKSGKFDDATELYVEIPSDRVPFEQRPWMKAAEITDALVTELRGGKHRFARVNYANGDMVGHTGHFDATVMAVEAVDLQLARLVRAVDELGGILVVTADHGNADEMFQRDKRGAIERDRVTGVPIAKTSHTLAPVPLAIHDASGTDRYGLDPARIGGNVDPGLASVTATCLELLGYVAPSELVPSLVRFR